MIVAVLLLATAIAISPSHLGSGPASSNSGTSITTSTGGSASSTVTVSGAFSYHMRLLASRNISAIINQYQGSGNITWTGHTGGLSGFYNGTNNMGLLLRAFLGHARSFIIGNLSRPVLSQTDNSATVNSSIDFHGQDTALGNFSGAVASQDFFVYIAANNTWLISQEVWNFHSLEYQFPIGVGGYGIPPTGNETAGALAVSADGNFVAVGTHEIGGSNGSLYLVSVRDKLGGTLWKRVTGGSSIGPIAISSDGSFVLAAGNDRTSSGKLFLFNRQGQLLWSFSLRDAFALDVALSSNGSRIAAVYGNSYGANGIAYFDNGGDMLWNYSLPAHQAPIEQFAMSSDGSSIVFTHNGLFDLNSRGQQVWNYTEPPNPGFVQISSGAYVAAATAPGPHNGSVLYFDGRNGALLWSRQVYTEVHALEISSNGSLAMSSDGSGIAIAGNNGVIFLDSRGNVLWNDSYTNVLGLPVSILHSSSLVLISGEGFGAAGFDKAQLVGYNGTLVAAFAIAGLSGVAASPDGRTWVASGGVISEKGGACGTLHIFDGSVPLSSIQIC
jgi:hypothetical protein